MGRCLAILVATLFACAMITALFGNGITPASGPGPGGLTVGDYVGMGLVLLGAFAAGRYWYRHELFLLYGGAGMLMFVPSFLSDGNDRRRYTETYPGHDPLDAILHDTAGWTIATVAMAVACMFAARWARSRFSAR